jgi:hypothetical protein
MVVSFAVGLELSIGGLAGNECRIVFFVRSWIMGRSKEIRTLALWVWELSRYGHASLLGKVGDLGGGPGTGGV